MPINVSAPDTMPWWVSVPLAAAATIAFFIIRHHQNKKESQ